VNHQIRSPKIRVVLENGEMLGVMSPSEALREGERRGLDLVEISPKAVPPVCKLMDYGKFKYEQKKKTQGQRKQTAASIVKEVSMGPSTDAHDLDFKMRNSQGWLEDGHRVKVTIRFRGREMAHPEIGQIQMAKVIEALKSHGAPESTPRMEGRSLAALFAPLGQGGAKKPAAAPAPERPKPQAPSGPIVERTTSPLKGSKPTGR
jgi:translation initiation factor IF-3